MNFLRSIERIDAKSFLNGNLTEKWTLIKPSCETLVGRLNCGVAPTSDNEIMIFGGMFKMREPNCKSDVHIFDTTTVAKR